MRSPESLRWIREKHRVEKSGYTDFIWRVQRNIGKLRVCTIRYII